MDPATLTAHGQYRIDQCLFGYKDGHTLLASSVDLPVDARRTLLVQTDYPGTPGTDSTVEGLVAGYPLGSSGLYALTKTWLAPEMPRPGCVFTHVLLLSDAVLGSRRSLADLSTLFRRPATVEGYRRYAIPIEPRDARLAPLNLTHQQAARIAAAVFLTNDPVVVATEQWVDYAPVALRLWSVEWPELRRKFMFSSGGGSPRLLGRMPFDLQFIPSNRVVRFRDRTVIQLRPGGWSEQQSVPSSWIDDVARYMTDESISLTIDQVWSMGSTAPANRRSFASVATLVSSMGSRPAAIVQVAADLFPERTEAHDLKFALLKGEAGIGSLLQDVAVLSLLIEDPRVTSAFDLSDETISEALLAAAHTAPNQVARLVSIAAERRPNVAREFLADVEDEQRWLEATVSAGMASGRVDNLLDILSPTMLNMLLRSAQPIAVTLVEFVRRKPGGIGSWARQLFESGEWAALSGLARVAPTETVGALLDTVNSTPERVSDLPPSLPWNREGLTWLSTVDTPAVEVARFLAGRLDPTDPRVVSRGPQPWLPLCESLVRDVARSDVSSAAFLFRLGIQANSCPWAQAVASGFVILHAAEASSGLSDRVWHSLEGVVAQQRFWGDWDRCRRLRISFIRFFSNHNCDPQLFRRAASQADWSRILDDAHDVRGAQSYVGLAREI